MLHKSNLIDYNIPESYVMVSATLLNLLIALGLGAVIGLERRLNGHAAGIHTHSMVSLGAAMFAVTGTMISGSTESARVISQIVTGVGFLCGGVIMRDGFRVRGLNTAASIWCSAAIGCLVAIHQVSIAVGAAALVLISNTLLHIIEHRLPWFSRPLEDEKQSTTPQS